MDERELNDYRTAYRELLEANAETPPSDEELAALVAGELDPQERDRIARRMLRSAEAIEKYSILQDLHEQTEERQSANHSWRRVAGVAAALIVAIAVVQFMPSQPVDVTQRNGNNGGQGQQLGVPGGNVALSEPPSVYEWTAEAAAHRYRIKIFDDAGIELWQSDWTTEPRMPAPPNDALSLSRGDRYFWIVDIEGAAARQTLGPYWFRIER